MGQAKSHAVLTYLYQAFGRRILRLLLKRNGGDLQAAEAVLQDTFVAAFTSFHTFRRKSTYFTWMCKIALNKLADYYRQQVNSRSKFIVPSLQQLDRILDPSLAPEEKLVADQLRQDLNKCLELLPPQYRRLLHLKYYQELSNREISLRLNLTPRKLEGRLYRARHSLAKLIIHHFPHLRP